MKSLVTVLIVCGLGAAVAGATAQGGATVAGVPVVGVCAALTFAIQWVAFVPAYLRQTERFYDLVGSLTYLTVVWVAVAAAGRDPRAWLLAGLVTVWAARLGSFLFRRVHADGGDGRFDAIKPDPGRFLVAWTVQGLWVFLTACAALAAITAQAPRPFGPLDVAGALVWAAGFAIEVTADRQKRAHRAAHPGRFVDTGLWAWSRHPNYFGEITLWTGVAISAAATLRGWQWVAMISPVFVTLLLTRVSGIPLLERRADDRWGDEPAYQAYKARTPVLVPRRPAR